MKLLKNIWKCISEKPHSGFLFFIGLIGDFMIGIIDSGKGGLAVSKYIDKDKIVIMDLAYFPYGGKDIEFLIKRSIYLCDYLISQNVSMIILACNTLSLVCLDFLRSIFDIKIYGIFDFIKDDLNDNLIIGSKVTYELLKEKYNVIDGSSFINDIQNNMGISNMINYIEKYYNNKKIVLACTHFLVYKEEDYPFKVVTPINKLLEEIKKEEL